MGERSDVSSAEQCKWSIYIKPHRHAGSNAYDASRQLREFGDEREKKDLRINTVDEVNYNVLRDSVAVLEGDRDTLIARIDDLEKKCSELNDALTRLKKNDDDKSDRIKCLEASRESDRDIIAKLQARCKILGMVERYHKVAITEDQDHEDQDHSPVQNFEDQHGRDYKKQREAKDEYFEDKLGELEFARDFLQNEVVALKGSCEGQKKLLEEFERLLEHSRGKMNDLEASVTVWNQISASWERRLKEQGCELEAVREEKEELKKNFEALKTSFLQFKVCIEDRVASIGVHSTESERLFESVKSTTQEGDNTAMTLDHMKKDVKKRKRDYEERRSSYLLMLQEELNNAESF